MELILDYLLYAFLAVAAINTLYYIFFLKFAFAKAYTQKKPSLNLPVSLIVCSKNEADNLRKHIPLWLAQDYPDFQLVLINDSSRDETGDVIESFQHKDDRIKVVTVQNNETFWASKKYALTLGIKAAAHEHLLFTDADCAPDSKNWLRKMTRHFENNKMVVLGYGGYTTSKNRYLDKLIKFETIITALQYFSYALWGNPYMGVGRNMAYTKKLFFEHNGFIKHMNIHSGDDDLFVNEAATNKNSAIEISKEAHTWSEPKHTFAAWFLQKRRHISTATRYSVKDQVLLGLFFGTQLLFLIGAIGMSIIAHHILWVLIAIGARYFFAWLAVGLGAHRLGEKSSIVYFPVLELFLVFFQITIFNSNLISKPNHWK